MKTDIFDITELNNKRLKSDLLLIVSGLAEINIVDINAMR